LLLLYFLKIKRRPVAVSSILLWHKSLQDLRANAPFQRLRRNLLLLLQLLVLLLVVGALARPVARGASYTGKHLVLLIDRSASMGSRDEDGLTRFEKALEIARSVASDPEPREIMVVSFGPHAVREIPFTSAPSEVREALDRLRCGDGLTNLADALRVAHSAARGKESARVVILSDGAAGALPELPGRTYAVDLVSLGRRSDNVGITALSARRPPEDLSGAVHLFAEVTNFSGRPRRVPLEVRHEGALADAAQVEAPAG
ncbi:MAG: VWA domain-containing protein, partial [Planctomycetes bacterium]|nr:VWA domain-containing protein [Planctomycetota bacterium]